MFLVFKGGTKRIDLKKRVKIKQISRRTSGLVVSIQPRISGCQHQVVTGEIGPGLAIGEVFRLLFDNLGSVLIAVVLGGVVGTLVMSIAGTVTLGLLILPASVWLKAFSSHLYGQISRQMASAPMEI